MWDERDLTELYLFEERCWSDGQAAKRCRDALVELWGKIGNLPGGVVTDSKKGGMKLGVRIESRKIECKWEGCTHLSL